MPAPAVEYDLTAGMGNIRYVIVAALPQEAVGLETYAPVIYSGVGKVKATLATCAAISKYAPDLVLNYGTAGSISGVTGLCRIGTVVERDMDARPLGVPRGVVPFDKQSKIPQAQGIVLGTGDNFVTDAEKQLEGLAVDVDLVDMEGFAVYQACCFLQVRCDIYKYASDAADAASPEAWESRVARGAAAFAAVLDNEYGGGSALAE